MNPESGVKIYGIKNCDTMKKAMQWLSDHSIEFQFIDYKKAGLVAERLPHWMAKADWELLLNRRGLMWKKLSDADRENLDAAKAATLMVATPALIKRPVLEIGSVLLVGFDADIYSQHFTKD